MQKRSYGSVKVFSAPSRDEVIAQIRASLPRLEAVLPIHAVYLFGSYALGNYGPGSDVDILVVYRGRSREDAYSLAWEALEVPSLQLHIYTHAEFEALRGQKPSPLDILLRDAITLWPRQE